jgi:hypothetical protein
VTCPVQGCWGGGRRYTGSKSRSLAICRAPTPALDPLGKPTHGNELPTGTGTHDRNRIQQERELQDNKAKGNEARKAGYGKGRTTP